LKLPIEACSLSHIFPRQVGRVKSRGHSFEDFQRSRCAQKVMYIRD
jgi:hypothetical protein